MNYLLARLLEASTWGGIGLAVNAVHTALAAGADPLTVAMQGFGAALAILMPAAPTAAPAAPATGK